MKRILFVLFSILVFVSCGGSTEASNKQDVKALQLSGVLTGTGDKIGYYWQNGEGLMPYLTYRALLMPNSKFDEVSPDLAQSYEVSEDGKTYTFTLKDNLKWSDGESLTVDDVKFSVEEALKVSLINGIFPEAFSKIEGALDFKEDKAKSISGIKTEGNKIEFKLVQPTGNFLQIMAQFYIFPKHSLEKENPLELHNSAFWSNPVTNGMFKVDKIEPGNYIELGLNPNYEGAKPKIEKVFFNYIQDPILAMQDGKSYFYSTNKPKEISQLNSIEGIKNFPIDILFYRYFIVNLSGIDGKGGSQLKDKKVREALLYAIDKKSLAEKLFPEIASLNYTGVPHGLNEELKDLNKYEYNPEKAKELLKEANYDFNKKLIITYYYSDQTSKDFLQAVSYQLEQAGIKNELVQIQSNSTQALFQIRKYDIAYKGFSSFGYESWYGEYSSKNVNFKNIYNSDTSFDNLNKALSEARDEAKRVEILQELQKLEQEKLYKLPLYTFKNYIFINTNKVSLPENLQLGNPFYRYDYRFTEWDIK